jgi:hypothetical protein
MIYLLYTGTYAPYTSDPDDEEGQVWPLAVGFAQL